MGSKEINAQNERQKIVAKELYNTINDSSNIIIVGRKKTNLDIIASAAGITALARKLNKPIYFVLDEDFENLSSDVKKVLTDYKDILNIISKEDIKEIKDENTQVILLDTCKKNNNCISEQLDEFKNTLIIDHHEAKEEEMIEEKENIKRIIYKDSSSVSEIVATALDYIIRDKRKKEIKLDKKIATLLYMGIESATDRFKENTSNKTHHIAKELVKRGANLEYINEIFRTDRAFFNTVANLVINVPILKQYSEDLEVLGISFTLNRENPTYLYKKEELFKSSEVQIGFKDTDVSFTLGYIKEGVVLVTAKSSTKRINVAKIMELLGGSGTATKAKAIVETDDINELLNKLIDLVEQKQGLEEKDVVVLKPVLDQQEKKFKEIRRKKKQRNHVDKISSKTLAGYALETYTKAASNVFVIGHIRPDFDCIGAAAGVVELARKLGRQSFYVIDEPIDSLDIDVKRVLTDYKDTLKIITREEYEKLKNKDSLLVIVDANKYGRITFKDQLEKFKKIIIIDHHDEVKGETIENATKFIDTSASSASELVSKAYYTVGKSNKDIKMSKEVATLLYSGIRLDTKRFNTRITDKSHDVSEKLITRGADLDYINRLFRNDRATYNTVGNLIINGTIINQYIGNDLRQLGVSFSLNRKVPEYIYKQEELAKTSDTQIGFKGTDVSFTLGYVREGVVSISARSSTNSIDVGKIMEKFGGGGNATSAGAQVQTTNIYEVEAKLKQVVELLYDLREDELIELEPVLSTDTKQFKKI